MASPFLNPQMYEQFMKNVTPEQINFAKQKMSQMSDEELKTIGKMSGMGNVDPSFIRSASGMAQNQYQNQYQTQQQNNQQNCNNTQVISQKQTKKIHQINQPFQNIVDIKETGNTHFRQQEYEQASQKYFEAILEIEEKKSQKINSAELIKLEISCRMNYAAAKSKLNDFDVVLVQAREVLKIEENPKAYFREGQALFSMGLAKKALLSLEKAHQMLPNDNTVSELYQQVKQKQEINEEKEEGKEEEKKECKQQKESSKESQKKLKQKKIDENIGNFQNDPILQKPNPAESFFDEKFIQQEKEKEKQNQQKQTQSQQKQQTQQKKKEKQIHEDVIIEQEEVKREPQQNFQQKQQQQQQQQFSQPQMGQYLDQFKNMSDDQLGSMCSMIQQMDSNTIKSIYKAQGMELSDSQISMMKTMYKPETIKMAASMQSQSFKQLLKLYKYQDIPQQQTSAPTQTQTMIDPSQSMPQPSAQTLQNMMGKEQMANLTNNPEMISTAMNMLKSNPEMLKSMSSMFGDNKLSRYLQNANSNDLQRMVGLLGYLATCCTGLVRAYSFVKNNKLALGILIGSIIVYKYRLFG